VTEADVKHRLAAILAADAAGYSRLMAANERATLAALDAARQVFKSHVEQHQGRVIDMAGDSVLAAFDSAAGAVNAALAIQSALETASASLPELDRMRFRIGVHLGDVIEKADGTIYGDGVNVAARLQARAEPGGIWVSDAVRGAAKSRITAQFEDQGEQRMKNIAEPVRAYCLRTDRQAAAQPAPAAMASDLSLPDKPSLAVLPFANLSGDPEQEYFADGVTEDIITDVSNISGLFVIARNTSFTYKKQNVDVKDLGRRLGVRHVLEGSVRKAGNKVRINVQLIDAASGGHVWAERFDRDLEDIFALQDEVAQRIVESLQVKLTGGEQARHQGRGKVNSEAYDDLLRARSLLLQFNPQANAAARALVERALAIEPGLARGYAILSIATATAYLNGWPDASEQSLEQALALARKAQEADPHDAMSWNVVGIQLMWLRRLDDAEAAVRRAIALDANLSDAHGGLGNVLHFAGAHEQAIASYEWALRLDPNFDLWIHALGRAQFALGRHAEAEASFRRRLIHMPSSDVTRAYLASLYGHADRADDARRVWDELMTINPGYRVERTLRTLPYRDRAPLELFIAGLRKAGLHE
jgi:adenylate cyclase